MDVAFVAHGLGVLAQVAGEPEPEPSLSEALPPEDRVLASSGRVRVLPPARPQDGSVVVTEGGRYSIPALPGGILIEVTDTKSGYFPDSMNVNVAPRGTKKTQTSL